MSSPFLAAAILALFPFTAPPRAQEDAARLLPADATVLVRLESMEAWNRFVRSFLPQSGAAAASYDLQVVLDGMRDPEVQDADLPVLDPARPLYFAMAFEPGAPPRMTFVAPVVNGKPFRFFHELAGATEENAQLGSYSGVSIGRPGYVASATPSPLVAGLRPGLCAAHVDLASIIGTFRPLIEMGLQQFEGMVDQLPVEDMGGVDPGPLLELYVDAGRALVATAEALDVALELQGDELAVRLDYTERAQREPAGAGADVVGLLGHVDPASGLQTAFNGSLRDMVDFAEPFLDAMLDMYPQALRSDMEELFRLQEDLVPLLAPGSVMGFDLGTEGMHGSYVLRSPRPQEVVEKIEAALRALDRDGGFARVGAPEILAVDDVTARVLPLTLQYRAFLEALAPGALEADPEEVQDFEGMMSALYGPDPRIAIAYAGETVLVAFGSDEARLREALARLRAPAAPAPRMLRLLREIEPGALGFAYHFDLGGVLGRVFESLGGVLPGAGLSFPRTALALDFWAARSEHAWSGGALMSLAELSAFVQAVQELAVR